jgi:hypothetical protein
VLLNEEKHKAQEAHCCDDSASPLGSLMN